MSKKDPQIIRQESMIADGILRQLEPILAIEHKKRVEAMKSQFRTGNMTAIETTAALAGLCALDDLHSTLRGMSRRGQSLGGKNDS